MTASPPAVTSHGLPTLPLVIGWGNEQRRDDGCGLAVARSLRRPLDGRARVVEFDGDAASLLDLWEGGDLVVVVDAVRSGRPAGAVQRVEVGGDPLPASLSASSTHGLSLAQSVALGRALGRFPNRLVLFGIEAGKVEMGVGMSPAVSDAVRDVTKRIDGEIPERRGGPTPPPEGPRHA